MKLRTIYSVNDFQEMEKNDENSDSDSDFTETDPVKSSRAPDHTDHSYVKSDELIIDYEAKLDALKKQFEKEKKEQKEKFEKEKRNLRVENNTLKAKLRKVQRDLSNLSDSTTEKGKKNIDDVVRKRLNDHFTEAQLDLILDKTREYSKKWCNKDFKFAMLVKMISPKVLTLLRKEKILPLPSDSTLKKKFAFMYVTQGYVHPSLGYLEWLVPRLKKGEEFACLSFDEMKLSERGQWDQKTDAVIGPYKQAQTFMVKSLTGTWKLPVYVDFDTPVTKSLLLQIIFQLEMIGVRILITTCDQAGANQGLAKALGIFPTKKTSKELGVEHDPENVTFTNPWDSDREIFFSFDWVHAFKNLRNHLLDDEATIEKGVTVSRADLLKLRGKTEVRGAWKLEDIHFYCKNQDRQSVSIARNLLSERSGKLMKAMFPNDHRMQVYAEFILVIDECFKILTSKKLYDEDPLRCALEVHLDQQLKSLNKLVAYMKKIKWSGKPRFNKGIRIAIKCATGLQQTLAGFGVPNLMTENHTQDFLESFFSVIKAMMWANNSPTALMFLQRVKYYVTQKLLEDDDFDIFSLKEMLEMPRDLSDLDEDFPIIENNSDVNEDLPELVPIETDDEPIVENILWMENDEDESLDDEDDNDEEVLDDATAERLQKLENKKATNDLSYDIGTDWIAASIASKFREDKTLGTIEVKMKMPAALQSPSTMFTMSLDKGGYLRPTEEWLSDVYEMDKMFIQHHPTGRVRKGTGVTADFKKILVERFPERSEKVLAHYTRLRTCIRVREMNARRMAPKRGTLRNARKQAETIY